jgi:hypothetical protein
MNRSITGRRSQPFPPGLSSDSAGGTTSPSGADTAAQQKLLSARSRAIFSLLTSRGNDESLDVINTVTNPTVAVNVVTYTPGPGQVAKITGLAVVFSNPFLAMTGNVGWRILITGAQPPYVTPYQFTCMGNIFDQINIYPLWVQSNDTVAIQVTLSAGFTEHLVVIGRITGQIFKPSSPQLMIGEV